MTKATPSKATKGSPPAAPTKGRSIARTGGARARRTRPKTNATTIEEASTPTGGLPSLRKTIEDVPSGNIDELLDATAWRLDGEVIDIMERTGRRAPGSLVTRARVLRALLVAESAPDQKQLNRLNNQAEAYLRDKIGRKLVADGPHPWPKRTAAEGMARSVDRMLAKPQISTIVKGAGGLSAERVQGDLTRVAGEIVEL